MSLISSIVGGLLVGAFAAFLVLLVSLIPGFGNLSGAALPIFYIAAVLAGILIASATLRR